LNGSGGFLTKKKEKSKTQVIRNDCLVQD